MALAVIVGIASFLVYKLIEESQRPPAAIAKPPPPPPPKSARFELVDSRPLKDKRDFDPGEGYGFVVAGDAQFVPDRVSMLRERLATTAGERIDGKRVELIQLVTWYVRTPKGALVEAAPGVPPAPPEEVFAVPELRKFPYWVICSVGVVIDGRHISARGTEGFGGAASDFAAHHHRALLHAADEIIKAL